MFVFAIPGEYRGKYLPGISEERFINQRCIPSFMEEAQLVLLRTKRLERLLRDGVISAAESALFLELEGFVDHGKRGINSDEWLASYHICADYMRLLKRVLGGLKDIGEPHAAAKYSMFMGEMGIMVPDTFSTPWDMTLTALDRDPKMGSAEDVLRFYGL